jgi:VanZ family protein
VKKTASMTSILIKLAAIGSVIFSWYLFLGPIKGTQVLFPGQDKLAHLIVYSTLALIHGLSWAPKPIHLAISLFLHGVAIELIQPYVGRTFEWSDMLANAMGIFLGLALYRWPQMTHCKWPKRHQEN